MEVGVDLKVGEHYPLPLGTLNGATADFFLGNHNVLQMAMPGVARSEVRAIKSGPIRAGVMVNLPVILVLFQIAKSNRAFTIDCPFDVHRIPDEYLRIPNYHSMEKCLYFFIHLVDSQTMLLKCLKKLSLHPETSRDLLSSIIEQRAMVYSRKEYDEEHSIVIREATEKIVQRSKMLPCGTV